MTLAQRVILSAGMMVFSLMGLDAAVDARARG